MSGLTDNLDSIGENIRQVLSAKDEAREKVLPLCRDTIRHCSESIRAVHRQEFERAEELCQSARNLLKEAEQAAAPYQELSHSGFFLDAQKEFAEASLFLAMVMGKPIPDYSDLGVEVSSYLNGMGEAAGEVRRYLLDGMRRGDLSQGESLLSAMDDIYSLLVTMDFPDAITGGLRRTTDMVRGVLEKTRSDLTLVMRQKDLEVRLDKLEDKIN